MRDRILLTLDEERILTRRSSATYRLVGQDMSADARNRPRARNPLEGCDEFVAGGDTESNLGVWRQGRTLLRPQRLAL